VAWTEDEIAKIEEIKKLWTRDDTGSEPYRVEGEGARAALERARDVAWTSTLTKENLIHHYVQAIDTFLASQAPAQREEKP